MTKRESQCLPVLTRQTVAKDGSATLAFRVFCPSQEATLSLDHCRACERCDGVEAGAMPGDTWLRCHPEVDDGREEQLVGELLARGLTAVDRDVPASFLAGLFAQGALDELPVVDETGRIVGAVSELSLARAGGVDRALPRGIQLRHVRERLARATAADVMQPAIVVHEGDSAHDAAVELAARHGRCAHVVNSEGRPVGVVRDVEVVRAASKARGG